MRSNALALAAAATLTVGLGASESHGVPTDDAISTVLDFGSTQDKIGLGDDLSFAQPITLDSQFPDVTAAETPDTIRYQTSGVPPFTLSGYVIGLETPPDVTGIDAEVDQMVVDLVIFESNTVSRLVLTVDSVDESSPNTVTSSSAFEFDLAGLPAGAHRLLGGTFADSPNTALRVPRFDPQNDSLDAFVLLALGSPSTPTTPVRALDIAIDQIAFTKIPEPGSFGMAAFALPAALRRTRAARP